MSKTWFVTGASRGLGLEVARAALGNGDNVVATARQPARVADSLPGHGGRLLSVELDVTVSDTIDTAVAAAVDAFGRIDVLVNNAGYGQLGAFEELSPTAIERQFRTNVFGVFDVTRAVLPVMRRQRSGHVITISSLTGIIGIDGSSIYCAAKFAVAGWSESLSLELARFGIGSTVIHPGQFRTDFLDPSSVSHGDLTVGDYADLAAERASALAERNHHQLGDPAKLARALTALAESDSPPARWAAGSDAVDAFRQRERQLHESVETWGALSHSTDIPAELA